jgi:hypothetical protein
MFEKFAFVKHDDTNYVTVLVLQNSPIITNKLDFEMKKLLILVKELLTEIHLANSKFSLIYHFQVNMGLETMLSIAIILGIVAGEMPKSSTLPLLGTKEFRTVLLIKLTSINNLGFYVLAELLLCTLGVGVSMLIMLAHQRVITRTLRPPWWLTKITFLFPNECTKEERKSIVENNMEKPTTPRSKYFLMENQIAIDSIMISIKRHNQVLEKVDRYIDEKKLEDHTVLQWIIIFDRIDIFFLILFNFINVTMSSSMLL